MIEIKYSGTALLLLANPCILHRNNGTACATYILIICKEDASLPAMFNLLYSSTNQQLFKRISAIKVTTMKITDSFCYEWKLSCAYHKINTFRGEWDTKEGTGKSMKNALHVQRYSTRYFSD